MRKTLHCIVCGSALTKALCVHSGKDPSVAKPKHEDGQPLTAAGVAFKSYEPIERSFSDVPALLEFAPQYWLNPDDLTGVVRLSRNRRRLGGCCGLAGIDGPNQLCSCGAEIGTLRTDCWTPLLFIPEPTATVWKTDS